MYINWEVHNEGFKQENYPVCGLNGQITCIFRGQKEASAQAKKWLSHGYPRSSIICKMATREEICFHLENEIKALRYYDKQFNSPESASEADALEPVLKMLKIAIAS